MNPQGDSPVTLPSLTIEPRCGVVLVMAPLLLGGQDDCQRDEGCYSLRERPLAQSASDLNTLSAHSDDRTGAKLKE